MGLVVGIVVGIVGGLFVDVGAVGLAGEFGEGEGAGVEEPD